jgi:large subunit ribosomal protein L3
MIEGLLGRKLGTLQIFDRDGTAVPVTVIETGPCTVLQVKTKDRDGYEAVQLGFGVRRRVNEPMKGHFKGLGSFRYLREFRVDEISQWEVGQRVGAEVFEPGDLVDVSGISKGRGFAGVVKRYGFRGGPKTHGQSDRYRSPGSIGASASPSRVIKGLKMAGHMGAVKVTVRNLEVVDSNPARGVILVKGSVPGAKDGLLRIRVARKQAVKRRVVEREAEEPKAEEPRAEEPLAEEPPTEEPPAEEAPAEEPQAEEAPTEEPQAEEAPAEEPSTEEPPAEEAPAEEPQAEEAPAEEPSTEEPPAEEAPAEEPQAEEAPAEEPQAEEPPAEEPPTEEPPAEDREGEDTEGKES